MHKKSWKIANKKGIPSGDLMMTGFERELGKMESFDTIPCYF